MTATFESFTMESLELAVNPNSATLTFNEPVSLDANLEESVSFLLAANSAESASFLLAANSADRDIIEKTLFDELVTDPNDALCIKNEEWFLKLIEEGELAADKRKEGEEGEEGELATNKRKREEGEQDEIDNILKMDDKTFESFIGQIGDVIVS